MLSFTERVSSMKFTAEEKRFLKNKSSVYYISFYEQGSSIWLNDYSNKPSVAGICKLKEIYFKNYLLI